MQKEHLEKLLVPSQGTVKGWKMGTGTQSRLEIKVMVSVGSYGKQQKLESLVTCKRKIFRILGMGIAGP